MGSCNPEILHDVPPYLRVYRDGTVERLVGTAVTEATLDPRTGVSSKDILVIPETGVLARLYRPPKLEPNSTRRLPVVVYFHGGAFCISSAFDPFYHTSLNQLVAEAKVIAVSVNYRNAPEHPLPAAYEDSWAVLQWVASHGNGELCEEECLREEADFSQLFLAGDSAGANISHHLAIRAGNSEPKFGLKLSGIIMINPYFWGEEAIGLEAKDPVRKAMVDNWWRFVCPSDKGCDDPLINPFLDDGGAEKLAGLLTDRVLISVAENDILVDRGRRYYEFLIKSKWQGKAKIVETPGEDHVFHIFAPDSEKARILYKQCASFINHHQF